MTAVNSHAGAVARGWLVERAALRTAKASTAGQRWLEGQGGRQPVVVHLA